MNELEQLEKEIKKQYLSEEYVRALCLGSRLGGDCDELFKLVDKLDRNSRFLFADLVMAILELPAEMRSAVAEIIMLNNPRTSKKW